MNLQDAGGKINIAFLMKFAILCLFSSMFLLHVYSFLFLCFLKENYDLHYRPNIKNLPDPIYFIEINTLLFTPATASMLGVIYNIKQLFGDFIHGRANFARATSERRFFLCKKTIWGKGFGESDFKKIFY